MVEQPPKVTSNQGEVKIVDHSFLLKSYEAKPLEMKVLLDDIVQEFSLNVDQEHAFCIVANHSLLGSQE